MKYIPLALGLILAYTVPAAGQVRIKERCTRDRCVYYDREGKRLGSQERDDTGRIVVKDNDYRVRAKITEDRDGTYRVERPRR